ncbi:transcription termination/antitermination factor NusG [Candidatus Sumerlaeota bacterium]|nr:transcription termination/antitermination factor NusG [Candidatus Sumerlaeota bacterium]
MNWYAIYTHSTFEKRVKRDIEHRASIEGLRDKLGQIVIPEEKYVEVKEGKKKESTRSLMPGYVFIQMEGDENLFKIIRDVNGVSQFVGSEESKPSPISEEEISNIFGLIEDKQEKPKPEIKFRKGDQVKVIEGPFNNFIGTVEDIDVDRARLKVMVSIFGRATPVDLGVLEVEKAS